MYKPKNWVETAGLLFWPIYYISIQIWLMWHSQHYPLPLIMMCGHLLSVIHACIVNVLLWQMPLMCGRKVVCALPLWCAVTMLLFWYLPTPQVVGKNTLKERSLKDLIWCREIRKMSTNAVCAWPCKSPFLPKISNHVIWLWVVGNRQCAQWQRSKAFWGKMMHYHQWQGV